jgi:Flp pilus assembly protein TadB
MMDSSILIGVIAFLGALVAGGVIMYQLFFSESDVDVRGLMNSSPRFSEDELADPHAIREQLLNDDSGQAAEKLKAEIRARSGRKGQLTLDEKFFQAGSFSDADKQIFYKQRNIAPLVGFVLGFFVVWNITDLQLAILGGIVGVLCGFQFPVSVLDRKVKARHEEIMYYLPLVIEQIAIGVSSSLDIGPCLSRVVQMADDRDTHNAVTELLRFTQNFVKSGASLDEALTDVGTKSGSTELKHTFMSLAQVAKHGGEVTRQLQELADAVAMQREIRVEEQIKKLELQATGPVALVFVGFMMILLVGFGLQIDGAF